MDTYICKTYESTKNLKGTLKDLQKNYSYIVKATDNYLSGWGVSANKKHVQLILFKDFKTAKNVSLKLKDLKDFSYVTIYCLEDYKNIYATVKGKTFTIRNDFINNKGVLK